MHDGDTGFTIPMINGSLNTRRATIRRKYGGVEIDNSGAGQGENVVFQDLPIGHDHDNLRLIGSQLCNSISDFLRLIDRNSCRDSLHLHLWRSKCLVTPYRLIRLSDKRQWTRAVLEQVAESRESDVSRSDEDEAHGNEIEGGRKKDQYSFFDISWKAGRLVIFAMISATTCTGAWVASIFVTISEE